MKKILVPVDFSDHTDVTCRYAVAIASANGGEIMLFHTYFDQMIITGGTYPDSIAAQAAVDVQMIAEIRETAEKEMEKLVESIKKIIDPQAVVNVVWSMEGGDAATGIVEICTTYYPDLIIIGAQGRGLKDPFSGSTAEIIMRHTTVPVLAIPSSAGFDGFSQIMYSAGLVEGTENDLRFIFDFFGSLNPVVHCVHLHCSGNEQFDDVKLDRLKQLFAKEIADGKIVFGLYECENHRQGLVTFLESTQIGMIAFKLHKTSLFGLLFSSRLSRKDLFKAKLPLLAFPVSKIH
ncbi:MAG TPA: hypothetical protein DCR43_07740 [Bacteroidales bacterium]|nr:MAG: hypothetical protein A2X11_14480 [Bacteroidetes bacterium GWE2_42_24]OFY31559.1 MAG: hypothetical protein A2X09_08220 [Bacteroidetes bacterium GWF2_43_11]HAQ65726.1 hypothetical protein [Bacteroidales bacterium]HBZ67190.1 hypothetical protein [Bacteroidales bacterium]